MSNHRLFCVLLVLLLLGSIALTACASLDKAVPTATSAPAATATSPVVTIEGLFDIGGYKLYLKCEGSGPPTTIYLHGNIEQESFSGASSGGYMQSQMRDRYRFCIYDRRNVGKSDEVPGTYTGPEAASDLHALLAEVGVEPPYVLLGASFGGLLSYLYAATYPGEVVGMVLLDAMFPTDLELDPLLPEDQRYKHEDDCCNNERLSHLSTLEAALALPSPAIPVTYLLAMPFGWELGVPAYDAVVRKTIEEYVASFSPGVLIEVQSPHYMEQEIPITIIKELEKVIELASY